MRNKYLFSVIMTWLISDSFMHLKINVSTSEAFKVNGLILSTWPTATWYWNKSKGSCPHVKHEGTWRTRGIALLFFNSASDADDWSASRPATLPAERERPRHTLHMKLNGPQGRSGHVGETISCCWREMKLNSCVVQPIAYSLYWLHYSVARTKAEL